MTLLREELSMPDVRGVLFDKDGTLFDFRATWGAWARSFLLDLAGGDAARAATLGEPIGYDYLRGEFAADSLVIAATPREITEALLPHVPEASPASLVMRMNTASAAARVVEAVPLAPLLGLLRAQGLKLGVATNDAAAPAREHLRSVGVEAHFDFVAGFDSGFGGKPQPGMVLAFADRFGLAPQEVLMVGDSRHDLVAARAAGARAIAVLTGMADEADLAPLAETVLPDIGHLPGWIASQMPMESVA
jgi:phosphoglycolate phosphatase